MLSARRDTKAKNQQSRACISQQAKLNHRKIRFASALLLGSKVRELQSNFA
jgi:hypothetical protein